MLLSIYKILSDLKYTYAPDSIYFYSIVAVLSLKLLKYSEIINMWYVDATDFIFSA